jgi:hypothetical protein
MSLQLAAALYICIHYASKKKEKTAAVAANSTVTQVGECKVVQVYWQT